MGGGWVVNAAYRQLYPWKDPVPIVQETGRAPGPVWTGAENLSPPNEIDLRTVRPVASRYTDWAIPGHLWQYSVATCTALGQPNTATTSETLSGDSTKQRSTVEPRIYIRTHNRHFTRIRCMPEEIKQESFAKILGWQCSCILFLFFLSFPVNNVNKPKFYSERN